MTLDEAVRQKTTRVRKPYWANAVAYLKIETFQGRPSGIGHLFERPTQEALGMKTPTALFVFEDSADDWEPYAGERDHNDID